ncbi:MAG: DNA-processing protein DprA [Alicyclobacillus sp.]|nr:DNA-processing protein DprA [Alicyclobacillus sp.]
MQDGERAAAIALAACPGLEPASVRRLVRAMGSAQAAWEADEAAWRAASRMRDASIERLRDWRGRWTQPEAVEEALQQRGIHCVVRGEVSYPLQLHDLEEPPMVLFGKGDIEPFAGTTDRRRIVSVVGTRRASPYALEAARWIGEAFGSAGVHVVSGLAVGVDEAVHTAVLSVGGQTSCVLACGVDLCYPVNHKRLYDEICQHGAVWSEYAPGTPVDRHRFPERNRLIAALASAVVVVQAGDRSGALVTVEQALSLGRDVYAVPGPITSTHFRGSNRLLYEGASPLLDPSDFLAERGLSAPASRPAGRRPPERWADLYDLLAQPTDAGALTKALNVPPSFVFAGLLELELAGWIVRVPGGLYRRKV